MINILILTSSFAMGGTEAALNSLLNKLDKEKYNVTVLSITQEGPMLKEVPESVFLKQLKFSNPKYRIFVSGRKERTGNIKDFLAKVQKRVWYWNYKETEEYNQFYERLLPLTENEPEEYDLMLDFHGYGYFLTAYGAKKICAKKKAMWIHDENVWWVYKIASYLREYDKIFCVSKAVRQSFINKYPKYQSNTEVFYNLTDTLRIRKKAEQLYKDDRYIGERKLLTIGRLEIQKGYDIALKAAEILKKDQISFKWFFMGDGNLKKWIEKEIKNKGLSSHVILLGQCENPYPYIKDCDYYVQPSRHEGYATTILEARVLKKIIVASDIPSNREQIQSGINGYLEKVDGKAFADRLESLIGNSKMNGNILNNLMKEKIDFSGELYKLDKLLR